jgi:hypothetical protein
MLRSLATLGDCLLGGVAGHRAGGLSEHPANGAQGNLGLNVCALLASLSSLRVLSVRGLIGPHAVAIKKAAFSRERLPFGSFRRAAESRTRPYGKS